MQYSVKAPILGFEDVNLVELKEIDELFSILKSADGKEVSFTVVNPYALREYSFDVPTAVRVLLDINENSNLLVYNVVVIQEPLDESCVNFLAPLIFNQTNGTMAQAVLEPTAHPGYGISEAIKKFRV